jgi:5-hydroxyisourate hydrolase-like protein (transthyretin family)
MDAPQLRREVRLGRAGVWALTAPLLLAPALFAHNPGAVEGTVLNTVTRLGVAGAEVEVSAEDGPVHVSVITDAAGRFRADNLPSGKYTASVHHDGFADPQSDGTAEAGFTIGTGGEAAQIRVELMPRANLRGRLLDPEGKPMAGVRVQLLRVRYPGAYEAETDSDGGYVFENVRPTEYLIAVDPSMEPASPKPPPLKGATTASVRTYYPGVVKRAEATPIVIPAGSDIGGFDFRLQFAPVFPVTGRVVNADGKPAAKVQVRLRSIDEDYEWPFTATSDAEGRFSIDNVPAGAWRCIAHVEKMERMKIRNMHVPPKPDAPQAAPQISGVDPQIEDYTKRVILSIGKLVPLSSAPEIGSDGGQSLVLNFDSVESGKSEPVDPPGEAKPVIVAESVVLSFGDAQRGRASIKVGGEEPEPLEVRLDAPFAIPFLADNRDGDDAKPQRSDGAVRLDPAEAGVTTEELSRKDGVRLFADVFAGRYRIALEHADPGYYLAEVMQGDRDILGQPVEFAPGSAPIRAVFQRNPGAVRGTVEGSTHATVVMIPVDERLRGIEPLAKAQCDPHGRFEIGGLRPGDYYALAFERVDVEALQDPAFVRILQPRAGSVKVERGATAALRLSVTPWPE